MENSELQKLPENLEQREAQKIRANLIQIANDFLLNKNSEKGYRGMSDVEVADYVQSQFQQNLATFFESSGLSEEASKCKDDEEALLLIATKSIGIHGWVDMLPNLIKENPGAGMNCTMASAMLHLSLEKLGYTGVRTVWVKGHHAVFRELEDGSTKLYDATSLSDRNGRTVGYSHVFNPEQIEKTTRPTEIKGGNGYYATLNRGEQDTWGGFDQPDENGNFTKTFYAYDPSIKMDIEIALGNLSEVKDDAREIGGVEDLPILDDAYLRAVADFLKANNATPLSDADIARIARKNPDAVQRFTQSAELCITEKQEEIPNPYDFFVGENLQPKQELGKAPDPNHYAEDAKERHLQAKKLCLQYPELENLDMEKLREQFKIFGPFPE